MSESRAEYYLHFVWTTQQRCPLLTPDVEAGAYRCMQAEARRLRCSVLALGGMPDHVHLAVKAPTDLSPAQAMKQIKGVSSKLLGTSLSDRKAMRWTGSAGRKATASSPSALHRSLTSSATSRTRNTITRKAASGSPAK
jgi:REP element-mobilizing transposase RayT